MQKPNNGANKWILCGMPRKWTVPSVTRKFLQTVNTCYIPWQLTAPSLFGIAKPNSRWWTYRREPSIRWRTSIPTARKRITVGLPTAVGLSSPASEETGNTESLTSVMWTRTGRLTNRLSFPRNIPTITTWRWNRSTFLTCRPHPLLSMPRTSDGFLKRYRPKCSNNTRFGQDSISRGKLENVYLQ